MIQSLIDFSWLIPLYGVLAVVLALPWSMGWVQRTGPRPAVYINMLMSLVTLIHGSCLLMGVWGGGSVELSYQWLQVADLSLTFDFNLSMLSVGVLELLTLLTLLAQVYALGYMEKEWATARFSKLFIWI